MEKKKTIETMFRVDGKIALVTGAAGGIGFACARGLAAAGAAIILADADKPRLLNAKRQIKEIGARCLAVACDVADLSSVQNLIREARTFGGIDILVHSAAVTNRKRILDMDEAEWHQIQHVNLDGAYHMGKYVGAMMKGQGRGGSMVFFVSTGAYRAGVLFGAYSASKAGVVMMAKTLALELAPFGVRVNAIAPTATQTRFTQAYYAENPQVKEQIRRNHPLGRLGRADDYVGSALYLSSQASEFVTGTVLVVDGGKTAK